MHRPAPIGEDLRAVGTCTSVSACQPGPVRAHYGEPRPGQVPPAARRAAEVLAQHVRRIAEAGRLRVGEERAAQLIHAAGSGTTLTLIALPPDRRDPALSELAREAVIAAITTDAPAHVAPGPVGADRRAARRVLPQTDALTGPSGHCCTKWLDRVTQHATF